MLDDDVVEDLWEPAPETHLNRFEERDIAYDVVRSWCGAGPAERYDEMKAPREEVVRLRGVIDAIATGYETSGNLEATKALDDALLGGPDGLGLGPWRTDPPA